MRPRRRLVPDGRVARPDPDVDRLPRIHALGRDLGTRSRPGRRCPAGALVEAEKLRAGHQAQPSTQGARVRLPRAASSWIVGRGATELRRSWGVEEARQIGRHHRRRIDPRIGASLEHARHEARTDLRAGEPERQPSGGEQTERD